MRETNSQKGNPAFKPGKKNEKHKKLTEELTFKKKENVTESLESETEILTQQKTVHMKMLDDIMLVHTKERIS